MKNVPGLEAVYQDYRDKVAFYYIYKSLAHPEKDRFVQPATLEERLLHVQLARKQLGTEIPWLADSMTNDLKHAFGDKNNSEFVISPEGKVLVSRTWSAPDDLRKDLEKLVGKSATNSPAKITGNPPELPEFSRTVIPRVNRPAGATPLVVKAVPAENGEPLYVKLRAEAAAGVLGGQSGKLHLGFHLDPIHHVHWNNLAPPLAFSLSAPTGVKVSPAGGTAPKLEVKADLDPREFLIDIEGAGRETLRLKVEYHACDNDEKWCKAITTEFIIEMRSDPDAGRVQGGRATKNPPGQRPRPGELFTRMDANGDGKITRNEARGRMIERFDEMDTDKSDTISRDEVEAYLRK